MNYLLHRQKFPDSQVTLPDGLSDLMGDICREALRAQPTSEQIYPFIANYLEALVETREKIQITKTTLCDIISKSTNIADLLKLGDITLEQANEAVNIMKKNFYELFDEKRNDKFNETSLREFKEVEVIAELVKKCEFTKVQILSLKPVIKDAFTNFIEEYFRALKGMSLQMEVASPILKFTLEKYFQDIPSVTVLKDAAISIQAAFRGYRTRKFLQKYSINEMPGKLRLQQTQFRKFEDMLGDGKSTEFFRAHKAATIIQRAYRKSTHLERTVSNQSLSKKKISSVDLKEVLRVQVRYDDAIEYKTEEVADAMNVLSKGYKAYRARIASKNVNDEDYTKEYEQRDRQIEHAVVVIQKSFRIFLSKRRRGGAECNTTSLNQSKFSLDNEFEEIAEEFE